MAATEDSFVHRDLTGQIIGAAVEVHKIPGTGFLERKPHGLKPLLRVFWALWCAVHTLLLDSCLRRNDKLV